MADEVPVEPEPAHVDFLRRMAEIDQDYEQGLVAPPGETAAPELSNIVDFQAARLRLRP